ncbi:hypothetical protein A33Q_2668 [Indibacter alkaliphilus LW1]|uniref:Uncharacterized protein n=1 Tax=Indibacter alkaliphilus (strain CCUG 57479 / KCTC 22604 / LW1) TaxID=1189612 RepID=S2DG87_INDAL|nr:hypothetical protein A33Q_2668 [Indibacter alkaliphilus LW1]
MVWNLSKGNAIAQLIKPSFCDLVNIRFGEMFHLTGPRFTKQRNIL